MANDTWIGGYQGNWTTGSNWSTGAAPGAGDDVAIANSEPLISSNVGTVRSVTISRVTNNNGSTYGTLDFRNGGMLAVSGNFTSDGYVNFEPAAANGGSTLTVGGTLTNSFEFSAGNQTITAPVTITVGNLVNSGAAAEIDLTGSSTVATTLNVNASAGFGTQGVLTGRVDLDGDALIRFASGTITSIGSGGRLFLSGSSAFIADAGATTSNSALALASNAGTLLLASGATVTTPGALSNGGTIDVGVGTATTSTLRINSTPGLGTAGVISGAVSIGPYGTIAFTQGGQLTGIAADSSLLISSATPFTAAGSANGVLALSSLSGPLGVYGTSLTNTSSLMTLNSTGHIAVDNGGSLTQTGSISSAGSFDLEIGSLAVNGTLSSSGGITVGVNLAPSAHPTLPAGSSVLNASSISLTGGLMQLGSAAKVATSNIDLSGNALLDLGGPANSLSGSISFSGPATLRIEAAEVPASGGGFANTVVGFSNGDTIDLRSLSYSGSATTASYSGTTLTVTNGSSTDTLTLSNPVGTSFTTAADGSGGTLVTVVCFGTGTLIRVARGGAEVNVAVEVLQVGDVAVTASGEHRPVRWMGSRSTHCRRHPEPHNVMPVRIRAEAFGPGRPARDLVVSPGHALAFDVCGEVLVPALALVNGSTIVQEDVASVTYWHVELEGGHDLLLAEGVPAESYLDMGNRSFFAGSEVVDMTARPDAVTTPDRAGFCRPFHDAGPVVEALRAQLGARAVALGNAEAVAAA